MTRLSFVALVLLSFINPSSHAITLVQMDTSAGTVQLELYEDKAPETVANFVRYVDSGFYNNLIFHRVIDGAIIQGGGYDQDMNARQTMDPISNEADNGLRNLRGTIAMARTYDPDSADSQFFINLVDNAAYDFQRKSALGYGYCVFGKVVNGLDVVNAIGKVKTGTVMDFQDVPLKPIVITSIAIISRGEAN